ncbi:MAG: acetyl-CoA synthetase [Chlorobi bacterium]|nr:acetyl-CoA synthetase [Chlorobiota bacterium]
MLDSSVRSFFYPETLCVVGASTKEKSIGYEILRSIKTYGYKGKVFPVNPKAEEVLGYKCFPSIEKVSEKIDLAIIVVPKKFVESSVDALIEKEVKSIIVITAGFRETGKEGEATEKRIVAKIKTGGGRMIGPNCMGVINSLDSIKLNATFVAEQPQTGATGFLSQSGALGAAVLNSLRETNIRFAHFISVGNKADLTENEILNFWNEDENIKTLTFYLESFENGLEFIRPFALGKIKKPTIVLKAGKTESGMRAASSHTGALGGKDKIADAVMKQFGIIRAADIDELFNAAKGFENFPAPEGKKIAVVTNAGGPAILAVDELENRGLALAELYDETKQKLREFVNPQGSVENPVDLLPGATDEIYKNAVETVLEDKNVDAVISIFVEPVMVPPMGVVEGINSIESRKPVYQAVLPLPEFWEEYRNKSATRKPLFRKPEEPAKVISSVLFYSTVSEKLKTVGAQYSELFSLPKKELFKNRNGYLSEKELKTLADKYGLPLIKSYLLTKEEINRLNDESLFPLAVKGINEKLIHKSDVNAVKLNVKNREELIESVGQIDESLIENGYSKNKFLLQPFLKTKHELLIGGMRDPSFGPIIMFGFGGRYVEALDDIALRSAYSVAKDVEEMIAETKIGKIIAGVRGEKPADLLRLTEIIRSAAKMIIENDSIAEFDINPLTVTNDLDLQIVDMRVRVIS